MSTYDQIVSQIISYSNNDDAERFIPEIPSFIADAETKISKELDLTSEVRTDVTVDVIPTGTAFIAKPLAWKAAYQFRLIPADGNEPIFLDFRTRSFCDLFWPNVSQTGEPRFYCEFSSDSLKIVPSLDKSYTGEHSYEEFVTGLSETHPSTWLSLNAPELLLSACLVNAATFMKNPSMLAVYEKKYDSALADERAQSIRQKLDNLSLTRM